MKLILTGSTGMIGAAVLRKCISDTTITKVYALTRRPLSEDLTSNNKVKNIIHEDFSQYPDELLAQLEGADSCIWSIGVTPRKGKDNAEIFHHGDVVCTLNGAKAFVEKLQPALGGKKFRFMYISAFAAERDQKRDLWLIPPARRSKGEAENQLVQLAETYKFDLFIARTGGIFPERTWIPKILISSAPYGLILREDQMAAALIEIIAKGHDSQIVYLKVLHALGVKLIP